jgi:hypothetical protein
MNIRERCASPECPNSNFPGRAPVENRQPYRPKAALEVQLWPMADPTWPARRGSAY